MSATQIYVRPDDVVVLTDGASYDSDGVVVGLVNKVAAFPHLNAALTANGPAFFLALLAARIHDAFTSFDELVAGIVDRVRQSVRADKSFFDQVGGTRFVLYVAGISESRGPEAWMLASEDGDGFRAWHLEPLGQGIIKPASSDFMADLHEIPGMTTDPDEFDPATHGLMIMEEQRRRPWEIVGAGQNRHIIGGFVQFTAVSREGIEARILQRWPDRIGEKITPLASSRISLSGSHHRRSNQSH